MDAIFRVLLFLFKNIDENNYDDGNKVLAPEVPFYGKSGTIFRIEEASEAYYKVLYNSDGSIRKLKIPVSKKKSKNLNFLLNDYIEEVRNYLTSSYDKYMECSNNKVKVILSNREYSVLLIVNILAVLVSIPFLFAITLAGLIFSVISFLCLYILLNIHKKDEEKIEEHDCFVRKYEEFQKMLIDYEKGVNIINLSKNNSVLDESNNDNIGILDKLMSNNGYREVA